MNHYEQIIINKISAANQCLRIVYDSHEEFENNFDKLLTQMTENYAIEAEHNSKKYDHFVDAMVYSEAVADAIEGMLTNTKHYYQKLGNLEDQVWAEFSV